MIEVGVEVVFYEELRLSHEWLLGPCLPTPHLVSHGELVRTKDYEGIQIVIQLNWKYPMFSNCHILQARAPVAIRSVK